MSNTLFLPNYTAGTTAYEQVPDICCPYGTKAVVIGGKTGMQKARAILSAAVAASELEIIDFIWFGGNVTHDNINKLCSNKSVKSADMIFAVGGGKALDTAKATADKLSKPVFTFPTIASNCAPVTSLCIIYNNDGSFGEFYFGRRPARHAFINTTIIANAPLMYLRAGIGDALSKQYEADFNSRRFNLDHENELGLQISRNCSALLLKYGIQALTAAMAHTVSAPFEQTILTIIVNTGLVSLLVNNSYNSSMAHAVYIARTQLPRCERHMHGEIVAYGVLFLLTLDNAIEQRNSVYAFNKKAGLPLCLKDIDVNDNALEKFTAIIAKDKYISYAPYSVNQQNIKKAIDALEKYHQSQNNNII
ncbi:iron-containing alcohol dehydrogenase family protein [Pectinatus sottacetonis]|uniref:iron-containing alcohol dehydrogenase family protein n=1 Tax=Pectinatus sottacetonis TaxID=1002795 RepID=UPI0018C6F479|nr:iron-containing alcohol dehydrogenase family protein [Pectinatus sottacetonis]